MDMAHRLTYRLWAPLRLRGAKTILRGKVGTSLQAVGGAIAEQREVYD